MVTICVSVQDCYLVMVNKMSQGTPTTEEIKKAVEDALPGFSALLDTAHNLRQPTKEKDPPPAYKVDKSGGKYIAVLRQDFS